MNKKVKIGLAIILPILLLVLTYFSLIQSAEKSGLVNIKTEKDKDLVKEKDTEIVTDNKEIATNKEQVIKIIEKNNSENQLDFKLYKYKKPVKFTQLDRVEQKTVSFFKDYFNASKEETVGEFFTRIRKKYLHPNLADWEFEEYIKTENMLLEQDKFPVKGDRKLQAIYLLPEYREERNKFVIPVQIEYIHDGEEVKDIIYFGIARTSDGHETIMGHLDNYGWYVQEVIKKYDLDSQ